MAEEYGYGRYRDDYDYEDDDYEAGGDDADGDDAEHLDAADYHYDDGDEDDTDGSSDESVGDARFLTGAMDEPVNDVVDDPAVNESPEYQRIRRMKSSRKGMARGRRKGNWIPPDLRGYGSPVFWPVEEIHDAGAREPAQGTARRRGIDDVSEAMRELILREVLNQACMTPLASCSEMAQGMEMDLEESMVMEAVQELEKQGWLKGVRVGCKLLPTYRYWAAPFNDITLNQFQSAVMSWHSDDGVGCLIRYDLPRVESIHQVAARYAVDGWALEGLAWVERDAVQAVGMYKRKDSPEVKSFVYFVWVSLWDTEREIWERLTGLPEAASLITQPGIAGSVALIGADRWAVAKALPMAVERLRARQVEPSDVAAWTYVNAEDGWQAASGASMLDGAAQPFRPSLAPVQLDRFVWPRAQRRLGKSSLESVINACPWTRDDARTLYRTLVLVAAYPGASITHCSALAGESDRGVITRQRNRTLLDLGLMRESGEAGVAKAGPPDRPEAFSERGQRQMRYRVSLGPKGEGEPVKRKAKESREDHTRRTANGAHRVMLDHGGLSYREIVRRSGVGKINDRLGDRLVHDDILVDLLGRFTVLGYDVAPASRAITASAEGEGIEPDGMLYCSSPVGTGFHYLELELSHLSPGDIQPRMKKYSERRTSYPLAVVCKTDRGARNFDQAGQEMGVPLVATSLHRLRTIGLSGPAWLHHQQAVFVNRVRCPPRP